MARASEMRPQLQGSGEARRVETGSLISPPSSVLTALKQTPLGVAIFDREMRYLAASNRFLTDQGLPADTPLVGRLHYEVFPEVPLRWRELHARVLREGVELSEEADAFVRRDGQVDWIRWSLAPWRTEEGEIGGLVLYTEIVTPSVEARMSLEAAEARYRSVFDQVAMGVARVSPDGGFLEVNDRFCGITGYSREELLRLTVRQVTHPDDVDLSIDQARALLAGRVQSYDVEKRYMTRAGEPTWVHLTTSLVRIPGGEPDYIVAIVEDISDRKDAEAEQQRYQGQLRLMINELNHRVKNTLATVQSMAAQTLRGERDPAVAFEKFEARLLGLSQVHDVLTRERWHGAALQEVAERAMRPFAGMASGHFSIQGPPVWLQPDAALTMALVFHELATNAVKYGALSVRSGRVDLSWNWDAAAERLRLKWVESGGPALAPPTRKGFGTRLIERALGGDLHGSVRMAYEPAGLTCDMEANLPSRPDMFSLFDLP